MDGSTSFLDLPEKEFVEKLKGRSAWKERSDKTLSNIHWPEFKNRTGVQLQNLQCSNTPDQQSSVEDDPFAIKPDLLNKSSIKVVYLGNSMLERLKTTGASTQVCNSTVTLGAILLAIIKKGWIPSLSTEYDSDKW
jgi:hypothetical protein